jgi:uncharacterized membrane protein
MLDFRQKVERLSKAQILVLQNATVLLSNQKIRKYLWKTMSMTMLFSLILWGFSRIFVVLFTVLDLFGLEYFDPQKVHDWVDATLAILPYYTLLFVRYLYPYPIDRVFLESLQQVANENNTNLDSDRALLFTNAELLKLKQHKSFGKILWALTQNPRGSIHVRLLSAVVRRCKRWAFLVLLYILSKIPRLGILVWPLSTALYLYKSHGLELCIMFLVGGLILPFKTMLIAITDLRVFHRELLEPLLCRTDLKWSEKGDWYRKNQSVLFGATAILYPFLKVPIFGPVVFVFSQSVISIIALHYFDFKRVKLQ